MTIPLAAAEAAIEVLRQYGVMRTRGQASAAMTAALEAADAVRAAQVEPACVFSAAGALAVFRGDARPGESLAARVTALEARPAWTEEMANALAYALETIEMLLRHQGFGMRAKQAHAISKAAFPDPSP